MRTSSVFAKLTDLDPVMEEYASRVGLLHPDIGQRRRHIRRFRFQQTPEMQKEAGSIG